MKLPHSALFGVLLAGVLPALSQAQTTTVALLDSQPGAYARASMDDAADRAYLHQLRRHVDAQLRYPTSREMRQLRPTGTTHVWVDLDRSGRLLASGVQSGSGLRVLDREALRDIRNRRFLPLPDAAFMGQATHRFVIAIEYRPGSA